jgi:hypothetical protein
MLHLRFILPILSILAIVAPTARAEDQVGVDQPSTLPALPPVDSSSDSAAINQALDQPLPPFRSHEKISATLVHLSGQTGVHITAAESAWDALPYGPDTVLTVNMRNVTLRQALDRIARRVGLIYTIGADGVILEPTPPLARMGHRASMEDLALLDLLAGAPADLPPDTTVHDLVRVVDRRLFYLHQPYAIQDRAFDPANDGQPLSIPRNATLMDALEQIPQQTDATWYPSGSRLLIVSKVDAIRTMLSKPVDLRFDDESIEQVLSDLSDRCGVSFIYAPGALQRIPPAYRRVSLTLHRATVDQTLSIISGQTGLTFEPTADGVKITNRNFAP